jgi:hypothetical protein
LRTTLTARLPNALSASIDGVGTAVGVGAAVGRAERRLVATATGTAARGDAVRCGSGAAVFAGAVLGGGVGVAGAAVGAGDALGVGGACVAGACVAGTCVGVAVAAATVSVGSGVGAGVASGSADAVASATGAFSAPCLFASESPAPMTKPSTTTPIRIGISGNDDSESPGGWRRERRGGSCIGERFRRAHRAASQIRAPHGRTKMRLRPRTRSAFA